MRRRLCRQFELELAQQELLVGIRLGMPAEHQDAAVGCWKVYIEHLDGGDFSRALPLRTKRGKLFK